MKNILITVLFLASSLFLAAQPKITFVSSSYNYGEIKEDGGLATTVFEFTNDGDKPLILNNVKATCGCTTPAWTKDPVAPGAKGSIKVTYNPKNRPGNFSKTINVYSNTQPSIHTLKITGKVLPREKTMEELYPRVMGPLRFKSNYLSLGSVLNTETAKTGTLQLINTSDSDVKLGVHRIPAHMKVTFSSDVVKPGEKATIDVVYDATAKSSYGYVNDRVYLTINDEKNNRYSFSTSATINEDFSSLTDEERANAPKAEFETKTYQFGTINQGDKVTTNFKLTNTGKSTLILRRVKTSCGCTAVKHADTVAPGESIDLEVVFNSRGKRGRQNKNITVTTNDPDNSTVILRIMGTVNVPAN